MQLRIVAFAVAWSTVAISSVFGGSHPDRALSTASVELIESLDEFLESTVNVALGPSAQQDVDPTSLVETLEGSRSSLISGLLNAGMSRDRAEWLINAISNAMVPTDEIEAAFSEPFPREENVRVWFERVAVRDAEGDGLLQLPSLLVAPRVDADADEFETAWLVAGFAGPESFTPIRGAPRTRTLSELVLGELQVTPLVGDRVFADLDALERAVDFTRTRVDRMIGSGLPDRWSPVRVVVQSLAALQNLSDFVLAQHLIRAESEQRLHLDPDIELAIRSGANARSMYRSLDVASRLDVVSRCPGIPAQIALADIVASPAARAVVEGGAGNLDLSDPDGLALNALLVAASFDYPDHRQESALPSALDPASQATARFIGIASGGHAGLSLGPVARAARDRMTREAMLKTAVAIFERGSPTDDPLLIRLLEYVVDGNPQDTELVVGAIVVATNMKHTSPNITPWVEAMIAGYRQRRIPYTTPVLSWARIVAWHARTKLQQSEFHEAAASASMVLMVAPQDFQMLRIVALGARHAGSKEVATYWARQAEAAAANASERAAAAELFEMIDQSW
ncbi:MAG: hypothetical protein CMJ31_11650 [Phycisphaerae bacterium]|nr:hypothetical protein [Phycisphaerae bacterium]